MLIFHFVSQNETEKVYVSQIEDVALEFKKDFLKDTVNNIINQLDYLKTSKQEVYQLNTDKRLERLSVLSEQISESEFIDMFEREFKSSADRLWTAYLLDMETNTVIFSTEVSQEQQVSHSDIDHLLATEARLNKGTIAGVFGVSHQYIDTIVKSEIRELIHHQTFDNGAYIWVNEIIDYAGGDDYAIRRIHPNLVETEGDFLSTSMTDVVGGKPYLTELNGINEHGELFFTYYFKKMNSEKVSKKITYAKLYKPYDWVVAMGVHLDDIEGFVADVRKESENLLTQTILYMLLFLLLALIVGFALIYAIMERNIRKKTKRLMKEVSTDPLTHAESRRYGEQVLAHQYDAYHLKKMATYLAMIDIDNFKQINDQFGHDAGDMVLKQVVSRIKDNLGESSHIIRWGGDEFIVVTDKLEKDEMTERLDHIIYHFETHPISFEADNINVSLSIGLTAFTTKDEDYQAVVKRADEAMYKSKELGKCRLTLSRELLK